EDRESRIEIRSAKGTLLRWKSFVSADGEHGFGITKAQWIENQFFVFSLENSGGDQPWHQPIYFYSQHKNRFYRLDDYIGPITSDFTITKPDAILTTRLVFTRVPNTEGKNEKITVRLKKIQKKANAKT